MRGRRSTPHASTREPPFQSALPRTCSIAWSGAALRRRRGSLRRQLFRRQLEQFAAGAVGQHVDSTVLKDADVANPLVEIREQRFLVDDLVVLTQLETKNRLTG